MPGDAATVLDIVLAARRVGRFAAGADEAAFLADEQMRWAIASQLMRIGEAVRHLSDEFRHERRDTPWRHIAGMRHRLLHRYDKINWSTVWTTVTQDIPVLLQQLEPLVREQASKATEKSDDASDESTS